MDYGSLLQLAKKNADLKNGVKPRVLTALPPVRTAEDARKQEVEKKKLLDANVAKFLAKRKDEEARKKKEANEKRGELLALRNKDSKARRRVKVMNSSAKSADKCAIQDAVGPSDYYVIEEPLCFMSQESLAQEEKFLNKLCNGPAEEKFPKGKANTNKDLMGTKNRVKLALQLGDTFGKEKYRVEKDSTSSSSKSTHKKEEKRSIRAGSSDSDDNVRTERKEPPKKFRKPQPPPMNYQDLLLLAEKLHKEPIKDVQEKETSGLRPMTTKERETYLQEEASRKRKEAGWKEEERLKKLGKLPSYKMPVPSQPRIPKISATAIKEDKPIASIPRIPKLNSSQEPKLNSSQEKKISTHNEPNTSKSNSRPSERPNLPKPSSDREKGTTKTTHSASTLSVSEKNKTRSPLSTSKQATVSKVLSTTQTSKSETSKLQPKQHSNQKPITNEKRPTQPVPKHTLPTANVKPRQFPPPDVRSKGLPTSRPSPSDPKSRPSSSDGRPRQPASAGLKPKQSAAPEARPRQMPGADTKSRHPSVNAKPRQFPPPDVKPRQFPPSDVKPRQFPPPDVRSRPGAADSRPKQFPPSDMKRKPKPVQKRRIIESDDEYDSDVADFIDDGPEGNDEDYSKHIREIFGYDPSRYKGIDEDDRGMESSFQQQLKEEFTSTKLGILEDLEDIKKEKMAMLRKKKKQRVK